MVNLTEVPGAFFHTLFEGLSIFNNTRFDHFPEKVISLTGPFSHTGKNRDPFVFFCDVVDKLHDDHCLSNTSSTEKTNLSTLCIGFKQVDYFDTGEENLCFCGEVFILWGVVVHLVATGFIYFSDSVNGFTNHIKEPAFNLITTGHGNGMSGGQNFQTTLQSVSGVH